MAKPLLVIGNKTYSSWSLRGWLALKLAEIEFHEMVLPLDTPTFTEEIGRLSPSRQVPALRFGDWVLHDSLAILEWAAEQDPRLWPADPKHRAVARAVTAEMHSGFAALRQACPMNLRRAPNPIDLDGEARNDAQRVAQIWQDGLEARGGPFLFGSEPGGADSFYAPMATRFHTYGLPAGPTATRYVETIMNWALMQSWIEDARAETAVLAREER
ncbi:MAG: glutathione S-transferase family protein [Rhodothalassiaceae bacterium]